MEERETKGFEGIGKSLFFGVLWGYLLLLLLFKYTSYLILIYDIFTIKNAKINK